MSGECDKCGEHVTDCICEKLTHMFLESEELLVNILRMCFLSKEISPGLLYKATGVDIDLCIEFMSNFVAEIMFNEPPENRSEDE
jgi:hypothetical protein